ncbi:hypothetical protein GRAN_2324 [Granulicella sibirica]|uniref:Uncharacterized protein n=2 Tax=Granulicella sibirica TaxID=2479048 RepID=A0A4Q0SXB0_9BACT|nr:hypothetical protein GRAN_2324 [Granulicella sibirica]
MAFAIAAGVFAGFSRTYYAISYFHSPSIPFWVHVHGAVFTGWILFYLLQNLLAMYGRMNLHRSLGLAGGLLASGVVVMGSAVALRQARLGRSFPFPDVYSSLAVSAGQMALFGVFLFLGLRLRRDSESHKRFILMATQLFFFPAFGRLMQGISLLALLLALCFYFAGPLYDYLTRRSIHPAYRWGVPLLILTMPPFPVLASHAPVWHSVVDRWLL